MSNRLWPSARTAFLGGEIDWDSDVFKVYLLSNAYTYDGASDFVSDLDGILGTPQTLTGCTRLDDGIADADDLNYPDVAIGETVERIVIARIVGGDGTSPLVYYADTNNDTTPIFREGNGGNIPLVWSASTQRVFKL